MMPLGRFQLAWTLEFMQYRGEHHHYEQDVTKREQESGKANLGPTWLTQLRVALAELPDDYPASYEQILQIRHQFLAVLSSALEGKLNAHVQQLPQETLAEKQQIAVSVNRDLRSLNLCLRCPDTGKPAILCADFRDDENRSSRFRFQITDASGKQLRKHASSRVPHLDLVEAPAREEGLAMRKRPPEQRGR